MILTPLKQLSSVVAALATITCTSIAAAQAVIYVNINEGSPTPQNFGQDGWGEQTAYDSLHSALVAANGLADEFNPVHLWVANGVYKPKIDDVSGNPIPFSIPNNVRVFGGFVGNEDSLDERNGGVHDPAGTILSGDYDDDDVPNNPSTFADNAATVVSFANTNFTARLDTVTIVGGKTQGVHFNNSDAILSNCILKHNGDHGVRVQGISNVRLINIEFAENQAGEGALTVLENSTATVVNSLFHNNTSTENGGAVSAIGFTFGVCDSQNWPCPANVVLINCTIADNHADNLGGGVYRTGNGTTTLKNSIVWGNTDSNGSNSGENAQIRLDGFPTGEVEVSFSCIQDLTQYQGNENIGDNPEFVNPSQGDFRLDVTVPSPCIDSGDLDMSPVVPLDQIDIDVDGNTTKRAPDLDLMNRTNFSWIDMGAFEAIVDCNGTGNPDHEDIENEVSEDCNNNGTPDECDIASGFSQDCNGNNRPDECDIADNPKLDCNRNGIIDSCEIECDGFLVCDDDCLRDVDIVIVLDTSSSMTDGQIQDICDELVPHLHGWIDTLTSDTSVVTTQILSLGPLFPTAPPTEWCGFPIATFGQHFGGYPVPVPEEGQPGHGDCDVDALLASHDEAVAPGAAVVAEMFDWTEDAI